MRWLKSDKAGGTTRRGTWGNSTESGPTLPGAGGELPNFWASVSLAVKRGWHCGPFQKCHEDQMRTEKCSDQDLRVSTTSALVIVFQIQENLPIVDYSA